MNITQGLLIALLSLPIIEIYVLIHVGATIGFIPTLALLIGAAFLGTYLLQTQGWSAWQRLRENLAQGKMPERDLMDSFIILAGGMLLLLPGFLSDVAGLLCLIPATRRMIGRYLLKQAWVPAGTQPRGPSHSKTIDGEFKRED
jgi:UPF0716 protein FxsA